MDRVFRAVSLVPRILILVLMVTVLVDMMLGVFFRYVVGHALPWSEEVGTFCLIWLTFVGGAVGVTRRSHFSIELAVERLAPRLRRACRVLVACLIVLVGALLMYNGWLLVLANASSEMPSLGFSLSYEYAAPVIGGLLMIVYGGALAFRALSGSDAAATD